MFKYSLSDLVNHLHPNKGPAIVASIQGVLKDICDMCGNMDFSLENGPWLGGGCLRQAIEGKRCETDFDVFFKSHEQFNQFNERFKENRAASAPPVLLLPVTNDPNEQLDPLTVKMTLATEHIVNYTMTNKIDNQTTKVQFIHGGFYRSNVNDLFDNFDYTICQLATDGRELLVGPYTLIDIAHKKLTVHKITFPVASMTRAIKYGSYGYKMCNGEANKFLMSVIANPLLLETRFAYID